MVPLGAGRALAAADDEDEDEGEQTHDGGSLVATRSWPGSLAY